MALELPFRDGYIDARELPPDATYDQVMQAIQSKIATTKEQIDKKESEMAVLRSALTRLEHEERTIWLLFKDRN